MLNVHNERQLRRTQLIRGSLTTKFLGIPGDN